MGEYYKELSEDISKLIGEKVIVINENHFAVYTEKNEKIISQIKANLNWIFVKMKGDADNGTVRMIFQRKEKLKDKPIDIEKRRRQVRDALNKTRSASKIESCAEILEV